MIKFRQKNFVIPLAAATIPLTVASTALPMIQASKQGKEAKEQAEQNAMLMEKQNALIKQQNRQSEKLAMKNPRASAEFGRIKQATYSVGSTLMGIGRAGKAAFGSGLKGNIVSGLGIAGTTYAAGKYISHDMKKQGLDYDQNGNLVSATAPSPTTKSYSDPVTSATGTVAKKSFKNRILGGFGKVGSAVLMGGGPDLMGYHADKKALRDQVAATQSMQQSPQMTTYSSTSVKISRPKNRPTQKNFALNPMGLVKSVMPKAGSMNLTGSIRSLGTKMSNMRTDWAKNWKTKTTGGLSSLTSFGLGGTKSVQKFGQSLKNEGGSLAKVGNWIEKHPARANLASTVPLAAAASLTWDGTVKAGNAIGKKVDPSAYKYKDAKAKLEQQQPQQY